MGNWSPPLRTSRLVTFWCLALVAAACVGAPESPGTAGDGEQEAAEPTAPGEPVTLNILDVGGILSFTEPLIEDFQQQNPDLVADIQFLEAPSTEAVSRIRAEQAANRVETHLVLSGSDAIGAGLNEDIWMELLPQFEDQLANTGDYTETARSVLELAEGRATVVATEFTGPLLEYMPDRAEGLPQGSITPEDLLAWAEEHGRRFAYAAPPSSGPGRQLLMGLPYVLGDEDPLDPENGWDRTWEFLASLDEHVGAYPASTSETMEGLAQGRYDLIATAAGWDMGTRAEGVIPEEAEILTFDNFTWILAGHYMAVPVGIDGEHLYAVLELMNHMLEPDQQVKMYGAQSKPQPGPAVEGVTPEDAPADVRARLAEVSRPEYERLFEEAPTAPELPAEVLAEALDRWEREVGG